MKVSTYFAPLLVLVSVGAAQAQQGVITTATSVTDWHGFYLGGNIGGAWNHTCNTWEPGAAIRSGSYPALASSFYNRDCPDNGSFIGGVDLGYNFQYEGWVFGASADYEAVGSSSKNHSYSFAGAPGYPIPPGTYITSGRVSPDGIVLVGPRVGYAFDQWLPYLRAGAAFALGSTDRTIFFAPVGATAATDRLGAGSKNYDSSGWNVGAGVEYNLFANGPWSLTAEYNYVNLGAGSNNSVSCSSHRASFCTDYANFQLDNIHNSFTMSVFRVGFHYRFGGRPTPEAPVAAAPPPPPPAEAPPPPPPPPCHAPAGFKVDANCHIIEQSVIVRSVDFEFNLSQLTVPAQQTLDEVASALLTQPELHVEIQGHTDSIGSVAYNQNLSQRRAEAVKAYLVSKGLSAANLTAQGYGKSKPIVSNDTAEGRAQNRRVAFEVTNVPTHVNVVNKAASAASTEAAQQGEQPKPKKKESP